MQSVQYGVAVHVDLRRALMCAVQKLEMCVIAATGVCSALLLHDTAEPQGSLLSP